MPTAQLREPLTLSHVDTRNKAQGVRDASSADAARIGRLRSREGLQTHDAPHLRGLLKEVESG